MANEKLKAYRQTDEYRRKNRERMEKKRETPEGQAYIKRYVRTPKHRYSMCKKVAKEKSLDFAIGYEFYKMTIINPCYYCSRSLKEEAGYSLDRIDNTKGYLEDNVRPCCGDCNRRRHDSMSSEEFRKQSEINGRRLPELGSVEAVLAGCVCSFADNVYYKECKVHGHLASGGC